MMFGIKQWELDSLKITLNELTKEKWVLKREIWKLQDQLRELGNLCGYEIKHQEEKDIWDPLAKK